MEGREEPRGLRAARLVVVVEQHTDGTTVETWQRESAQARMRRVSLEDGTELTHEGLLALRRLSGVVEQPQEVGERELDLAQLRAVAPKGEVHVVLYMRPALAHVHA